MRKFLPYILIVVILANIFAPFSVVFNKNGSANIKENKAEAAKAGLFLTAKQFSLTSDTISVTINFEHYPFPTFNANNKWYEAGMSLTLKDTAGNVIETVDDTTLGLMDGTHGANSTLAPNKDFTAYRMNYTFKNLKEATEYRLYGDAYYDLEYLVVTDDEHLKIVMTDTANNTPYVAVHTYDPKNPDSGLDKSFNSGRGSGGETLPNCGIDSGEEIAGCGIQLLYWGLFVPTSYIFMLAGKFFDWSFAYSITDTSYRTAFVTEGWGIVRDICNIFFIFVLIYAAFGLILGIHSIKAKEIIINTVLMGLLINFSLFAGQVLIDTSNILARVFYNSQALSITVKDGASTVRSGIDTNESTGLGELSLSAAIVDKIDPQKLILEADEKITTTNNNLGNNAGSTTKEGHGIGTYFLIIIMAIAVNIVGIFVFISVALIFIARVIGLWFAMIFAPLAFFSYTVPQMEGIAMVGWKKWWPDTLGLCFIAPMFMFFMYLILMFIQTGFTGIIGDSDGANWLLGIIVPFIFIMMLLLMAKKLAKSYSGEMGRMVTGAVTAAGAVALGGAALGGAFLARNTVGSTAKMLQNDNAREKTLKGQGFKDIKGLNRLNPFAYAKQAGKYATATVAQTLHMAGGGSGIGAPKKKSRWQKSEEAFNDQGHAKSALDAAASEVSHGHTKEYGKLVESEQKKARMIVDKDELSKSMFNVKFDKLEEPGHKQLVTDAVNDYHGQGGFERDPNTGALTSTRTGTGETGVLAADRPEIYDRSGKVLLAGAKSNVEAQHSASHMADLLPQSQALGEFSQALRQGSMDIRNLSQVKTSTKGLAGLGIGAVAMIATGVRLGLKQGAGVEHGKGQGDFFKDLGHTISEAMKSVKIEMPKNASGGGHAAEDHGGGGHGGGGGGHH